MNIAIFTWFNWGRNYGQTLQAYALQMYLRNQGHNVVNIAYGDGFGCKYRILNNLKRIKAVGVKNIRTQYFFDSFVKKNMRITQPLLTKTDINKYLRCKKIDVMICGSDQVWNPTHFDEIFYLNVGDENLIRISYAVSIIALQYIEEFNKVQNIAKECVGQIDALSVRENTGKEIVEKLFGKEAQVVLDPVFLLDRKQWEKFVSKPLEDEYLLVYLFTTDEEINNLINRIMLKFDCKGIVAVGVNSQGEFEINSKKNVSVPEFISLIRYAKVVLTDSFHATAFSVIFQKEMWILDNGDKSGDKYYNIDRMNTLLSNLYIEDRIISPNHTFGSTSAIDYLEVEKKLELQKEESKKFLKRSLSY